MELKSYDLNYEEVEILPISDTHIGDLRFDEQKLNRDIEWILEKPNRFAILNGDIFNCATIRSVSDVYKSKLTPRQELRYGEKIFEPIEKRILGGDIGNHEKRIARDSSLDLMEELSLFLGTYYRREGIFLKLRVGKNKNNKQVYTLYATHGFTGSRTVGGKANRLAKLRHNVLSDIFVLGHSHQQIAFPYQMLVPDLRNNKVNEKIQVFLNSAGYLKYGGYGEEKAYSPTPIGCPSVKLFGKEKKMSIEMLGR